MRRTIGLAALALLAAAGCGGSDDGGAVEEGADEGATTTTAAPATTDEPAPDDGDASDDATTTTAGDDGSGPTLPVLEVDVADGSITQEQAVATWGVDPCSLLTSDEVLAIFPDATVPLRVAQGDLERLLPVRCEWETPDFQGVYLSAFAFDVGEAQFTTEEGTPELIQFLEDVPGVGERARLRNACALDVLVDGWYVSVQVVHADTGIVFGELSCGEPGRSLAIGTATTVAARIQAG